MPRPRIRRARHAVEPTPTNGVIALKTMLADGPAEPIPAPPPDDKPTGLIRAGGIAGVLILGGVAFNGAYTSWQVLSDAARKHMTPENPDDAWTFPFLIDALILGATLRYIYRVKAGYRATGWRFLVWLFSGMTIFFNVLASPSADDLFWHLVAPGAWVAITEIAANDVLGDSRRARRRRDEEDEDLRPRRGVIAWIVSPIETPRLVWREIRSRVVPVAVRQDRAVDKATRLVLRRALPGVGALRARRAIRDAVRDSALAPAEVLAAIREAQDTAGKGDLADRVLQLVLDRVLEARAPKRPAAPKPPRPAKAAAPRPLDPPKPETPPKDDAEGTGSLRRPSDDEEEAAYQAYAKLRREREAQGLVTTEEGQPGYISNGVISRLFTPALSDVKAGKRRRLRWEPRYVEEQQAASVG
jgi:hypothetical protein